MRKLNMGEDWKSEFEGWMLKGIEDRWLKDIESWDWESKTEGKYKIGNWKLKVDNIKYVIYNLTLKIEHWSLNLENWELDIESGRLKDENWELRIGNGGK